jgi:hypothetical protein
VFTGRYNATPTTIPPPMPARLYLFGFLAGSAWGAVAYGLGSRVIGPDVWAGVLAAPFIGMIVSRAMHPTFSRTGGWHRRLSALASLYAGATLFGVASGLAGFVRQGDWDNLILIGLVPWGITITGYVIALWPLAYGTHAVIEWRMDR